MNSTPPRGCLSYSGNSPGLGGGAWRVRKEPADPREHKVSVLSALYSGWKVHRLSSQKLILDFELSPVVWL